MKALFYLAIGAALLALGVYVGRQNPPKPAVPLDQFAPWPAQAQTDVVDPYKQPSLEAIYNGTATPPSGYVVDQPKYQIDPAVAAQISADNERRRSEALQSDAEFQARQNAQATQRAIEEASVQQQRSMEELTQAIKHQGDNP